MADDPQDLIKTISKELTDKGATASPDPNKDKGGKDNSKRK